MKYKENIQLSPQLAEVEINYKSKVKAADRKKITNSKDCAELFRQVWSSKIEYLEEFAILLLNRNNQVLGWAKISTGGTVGTVADPKVIFQIALNTNAHALILCHNHPSANTKPSQSDIDMTKKIVAAGKLLDIAVLDHTIITTEDYYSFADNGLI